MTYSSMKGTLSLEFNFRGLEEVFVFNIAQPSGGKIEHRDRRWKAERERFMLSKTRSACENDQSNVFSV